MLNLFKVVNIDTKMTSVEVILFDTVYRLFFTRIQEKNSVFIDLIYWISAYYNLLKVCVCVCLCSSTWWLLPAARHLWYTWGDGSTIFCCEHYGGCFCQVPSSQYLNLSYFTSKDENSRPLLTGEKTNDIMSQYEKMIYWYRI